jgi:DinB superfamily
MNTVELLDNCHLKIIQVLGDLPELQWDIPEVCGDWSVKEIVAHLTSYELALAEALNTLSGQEPPPYLTRLLKDGAKFNDEEVEKRRYRTAQHVLDEYNDIQVQTLSLLQQIPAEKLQQKGTMPWYGAERSLNDLIISHCNHASEHCAQIEKFRNKS